MNPEKPDISEIQLTQLTEHPFPMSAEYRIAVSDRAYEALCNHAKENDTIEICGVLIGNVYKDEGGPFLEISDVIRGEHADNKMGEVKFTQETWSYINDIKDAEYSDKKIVGWYHSHPRFGVFLSTQDFFIHKNFFNQPWQVAYVIDPITNEEGFFVWHDGNAVRGEYFWLEGKRKETPIFKKDSHKELIENLDAKVGDVSKRVKKGLRPLHFVIGLLIVTVMLFLTYALMNNDLNRLFNPVGNYLNAESVTDTREIMSHLAANNRLSKLSIQVIRRGNRVWCFGAVYTYYQQQLIALTISSLGDFESVDVRGVVATHRYTVLPGDNLAIVSEKVYGIPDRWKDIYQLNKQRINDLRKIQPSTTLELPE